MTCKLLPPALPATFGSAPGFAGEYLTVVTSGPYQATKTPIQNTAMIPRATATARTPLNHEWRKTRQFLFAHQTPTTAASPKATLKQNLPRLGIPFVYTS